MISLRQIQAIVHGYPAKYHPTRIEPLGSAGGMSGAQFWRIESGSGNYVLRRWPAEHPSVERLGFVHAVLCHAAGRGVCCVPVPIRTSAGSSFAQADGHLWQLEPWMPGEANYEQSPSLSKLQAAMFALARFHVAVSDFPIVPAQASSGGAPAIAKRLARLNQFAASVRHLPRTITSDVLPPLEPLARQFLATTPLLVPHAIRQLESVAGSRFAVQPCIRDIWHDHILFAGDTVTGIIDFGGLDIDTPATDIARLLGSLVGDDEEQWKNGIDAYESVKRLAPAEVQAVRAIDYSSSILAGCNWLQWIYVDRRRFEQPPQVIERFRRIVERCNFAATQ